MIDDDDADFAWLASLGTTGWVAVLLVVVAIVLAIVAASNREACEARHCPDGQKPRLLNGECLCVMEARP